MTTSAPVSAAASQEPRRLVRQVLHVGVEQQHMREAARQRPRDARPDRVALAEVRVVLDHFGAGLARAVRRAVGRSIVHDDDVRDRAAQAVHDVGNRRRFIERGNHADRRRSSSRLSHEQQRRQHQDRRGGQRHGADNRHQAHRSKRRIRRRDERAVAEQGNRRRDRG